MFKKIVLGIIYTAVIGAIGFYIYQMLMTRDTGIISVTPTATPTPFIVATLAPAGEATTAPANTPTDSPVPASNGEMGVTLFDAMPTVVTPTATATPMATAIPTATSTPTPTATPTATSTPPPTSTPTPTVTPTPTSTPTSTPTPTATPTPTPTATSTPKPTSTPTPSASYALITSSRCIIDAEMSKKIVKEELVEGNSYDYELLPDAHNTGANGNLKSAGLGQVVAGIQLSVDDSGKANAMNFSSSSNLSKLTGTAVIEGYDFSSYDFVVIYEMFAKDGAKILFRNCKFAEFKRGLAVGKPYIEFENCTFDSFTGSDASFTNCYFKNISMSNISSARNITLTKCCFADGSQATEFFDKDKNLRIGSVWTDNGYTYFTVLNFTGMDRKLVVLTETEKCEYTIPANAKIMDIKLAGQRKLVLSYDVTAPKTITQIRCYNETGKEVWLSKALAKEMFGK